MRKITLTLIIILFVSCGNDSAQEEERAFTDNFIQAATEKDPIERLEKLESLMAEGNEYERYVILGPAAKAALSSKNCITIPRWLELWKCYT